MININNLVRPNVLKAKAYSSSRSEFSGEANVFLDANENPFGQLNRYPDPDQVALKKRLAVKNNLKVSQVAIGNGSDELIDLLIRIFCRPGLDKTLSFSPTYGMYNVYSQINDVEMMDCPLGPSFQIDLEVVNEIMFNPLVKLIFICSPNNPTGNTIDISAIEYILSSFSGVVVVDEAYIDFSEQKSLISLLDKYANLVVLQTMSKAWGLASARIGMAYSSEFIVGLISKIKPPYNISKLNQQAAVAALKDEGVFKENVTAIISERNLIFQSLQELSIVRKVYPSETNYLLVDFYNANAVYQFLINMKIVVRNRCEMVNDCLRISIGTSDENRILIDTLKKATL